ncbi:MAG TPA: hypothetical protein VM305_05455 [Candidatus Limnocylindrales bacterium]|nr:hypothetical protein [Candidatus Limnocylindrales bacterium]
MTLTGPGGSGKTRLSIECARILLDDFPDGAWFVALDAVRDPQLVIPTIAQALGIPEQRGQTAVEALTKRLVEEKALLVLDNMEQVVGAAPDIASLLRATTSLVILASSRQPLAVAGEQVYPVASLALPAGVGRPNDDVRNSAAIELFVDRARAHRPEFSLTERNAPVVTDICRRLDGLPLAIELAAARINVLSPEQILARLDRRLTVLASSRRDLPDRQRTLRGAIDWSHDLLSEPERVLFRRCSVFAGGMELDAVDAVVDPERDLGTDILDLTTALVERSLLRSAHENEVARLTMLETIREYAAERLEEAGETAEIEERHAEYYASMGEAAAGVILDARRDEMLDRLERELGNLRAAIAWSLRTGKTDTGLRLTTALNDFWHLRNHIREGVRALEGLLAASSGRGDTVLRARALLIAGGLLTWLAEGERSRALAEKGTAMAERLGDLHAVAMGKNGLGWAAFYAEPEHSLALFVEATVAARAAGDRSTEMQSLMGQGLTHLLLGDLHQASARADEVIEIGDRIGAPYITSFALLLHGILAAERGELDAALDTYREALRRAHAAGAHVGTALGLDGIASVALDRGELDRGARLSAAADRLREDIGSHITFSELGRDPPLKRAQRLMTAPDFDAAVAAGRQLGVDEAVSMALWGPPERNRP